MSARRQVHTAFPWHSFYTPSWPCLPGCSSKWRMETRVIGKAYSLLDGAGGIRRRDIVLASGAGVPSSFNVLFVQRVVPNRRADARRGSGEYTDHRVLSVLGRWKAEYEYWRRLQTRLWDAIHAFKDGDRLPDLEELRPRM